MTFYYIKLIKILHVSINSTKGLDPCMDNFRGFTSILTFISWFNVATRMALRNSLCETYFTDLKIGCLVYVYSILCGHIKIQLHTKVQTKSLNELILTKVTMLR
jgi:hypothetical protein